MFTADDLLRLIKVKPFVPFRLALSDGGSVEVKSPELVNVGRRVAVVGLLDPDATDTLFDRWTVVWYMHVTRAEAMVPGAPPFAPPSSPEGSPTPA